MNKYCELHGNIANFFWQDMIEIHSVSTITVYNDRVKEFSMMRIQ